MNAPHSHDPQSERCGCSGKSEAEPASIEPAVTHASCCSGKAAGEASATVEQAPNNAKSGAAALAAMSTKVRQRSWTRCAGWQSIRR